VTIEDQPDSQPLWASAETSNPLADIKAWVEKYKSERKHPMQVVHPRAECHVCGKAATDHGPELGLHGAQGGFPGAWETWAKE
jgi:hypothetical protein